MAAGLRACIARAPRVRLVTLTLQHGPADRLADLISRLRNGFRRLRRQPGWQAAVHGGVVLLEISHGAAGWHPHLHILAIGSYLDHRTLQAEWEHVTGSSIVDIRAVKGDTVASYLSKYLTKPAKPVVLRTPNLLDECVIALRGSRMFQTFGIIKAADLDADDADDADDESLTWVSLGRLDAILARPDTDPVKQEVLQWLSTRTRPPSSDP